jgi:hypothetical protein
MPRNGWITLYVVSFLLMASCNAWQTAQAPFTCTDDTVHSPDPGTTECRAALAEAHLRRPQETSDQFFGTLLVGAIALATFGFARFVDRKGWMDRKQDEDAPTSADLRNGGDCALLP